MSLNLFPDISPTWLALALAVVTGGVLFLLLGLALINPLLLRMGLRNTVRRPGKTILLLCGLALATAVITASFGLQDSFTNSAITQRVAHMGDVDESVTGPFTQDQIDRDLARIRAFPQVQAASASGVYPQSPTVTSLRTGFAVHNVDFYALPPDFEQVYGPLTDAQGQTIQIADLRAGEALVSASLVQGLGARPGDRIQLSFGEKTVTATVRALLSNDIGITAGEAIVPATPQIILPLHAAQQIDPEPPNTISIRNIGAGNSQAMIRFLQQLLPGASARLDVPHALGQTTFDIFRIHPLKPDVVQETRTLEINKLVFLSPAGQQFTWLPPLFTCLLVSAAMLLLALLVILLAAERRAELGMSRALGLRRSHLVQLLLFEGCGYGILAALLGVPLGVGVAALELTLFTLLPRLGVGVAANSVPVPVLESGALHLWINWQSLLTSWCLGVLATVTTVLVIAFWISRANIVAAIRDLDDAVVARPELASLWRMLWSSGSTPDGVRVPETPARRLSRVLEALTGLLWGAFARGPLCLLIGLVLFVLTGTPASGWVRLLVNTLLLTGGALLVGWLLSLMRASAPLARRLSFTLIGGGWLALSTLQSNAFIALFQPVVAFNGTPSGMELLLSMLLPVGGAVILGMTNLDLLAALLSTGLRRVRGVAPISRTGVAYPLTFRFRTGITVALLSLIMFLVLLLVTTNLGAIQEAETATSSGGFQLQATTYGSQLTRYPTLSAQLQELQTGRVLGQDFAAVGLVRLMYDYPRSGQVQPLRLDLDGGQLIYTLSKPPQVADDTFLASTTLPMYARASGFSSDQQVWAALRTHVGDVVLQYDAHVVGLPASSGFTPFTAEIPDSSAPTAHFHPVTVIGLVPASAPWRVLTSINTARRIAQPPYIAFLSTYLLHLRPGANETRAAQDLNSFLDASSRGITVQSLDQGSSNAVTEVFTLLLGSDLALGLLFGALAISVITSRAVVERRQQIGMLRALGFSRSLVWRSFLLEACFVIAVGLLIGATLALFLAYQIARVTYQDFPLPLGPIALILLSAFLAALACTILPARQAARLYPAEALRYE
ncbi:ABC transporter permease [Ktedonobacteria bacterium brp13]|nr:ABC transporter permease [Ktedonobacteria bacterium brp13]